MRQLLTYRLPGELQPDVGIGYRVKVPLGRRVVHGYVVEVTSERPQVSRLKNVLEPSPPERLFDAPILSLTRWVADYYLAPWGQVLDGAVPPNVRKLGARDRRRKEQLQPDRTPPEGVRIPDLFPAQEAAFRRVSEALRANSYASFLLHGVTGSGKTEVYLRLARQVIEDGGQVLFLVPEIAMGTQILARVQQRFGEAAGLFHSQAGETTRRNVWRWAREGSLPMVVGARSAVFVPLPRLRLVIVDEEHEAAYKQDETPRYHGRDTAIVRAREAGAVAVLGSATPSLESLLNVQRGKHELLELPERIDGRPRARVTICNVKEEEDRDPTVPAAFSNLLVRSIRDRLDRSEQVILFLNRRGHSTVVQCGDCGASLQCGQCDVVLTYHRSDQRLRCHYCNATSAVPGRCPQCEGTHFYYGGLGTQRLEDTIGEVFPDARIVRLDRDATQRRGAHSEIVEAMEAGKIDILLGTQMVAKGFDFPGVTLVGVLHADQEMLLPDYRASERGFQILAQVAGRSGRGLRPGEVVFQTLMPDHYVIRCAAEEDFIRFAEEEMVSRDQFGYPPFRRMVHVLIDGRDEQNVERRAEALRDLLVAEKTQRSLAVRILGPAPMPISRLKGQYRWHLCLTSKNGTHARGLAAIALESKAPTGLSSTRVQVDVDPVSML